MAAEQNVRVTCEDGQGASARVDIHAGGEWHDVSHIVTRTVIVFTADGPGSVVLDLLPRAEPRAAARLSPQTLGQLAQVLHENGWRVVPPQKDAAA